MNIFSQIDSKQKRLVVAITTVLVAVAFFSGVYIGVENSQQLASVSVFTNSDSETKDIDIAPLWKVWAVLDEKYVPAPDSEEISDQSKLWGAVQGLASSFGDPYTVFFPPADAELFEADISGNFVYKSSFNVV